MIIANEARTIANEVLAARNNQLKLAAVDWVEKYAAPMIEKAAQDGRFYIQIRIEANMAYVRDYLENNGYKTSFIDSYRIKVSW